MVDQVKTLWTVSQDAPFRLDGHDFFKQGIDYDVEPIGDNAHWNKIEVVGVTAILADALAISVTLAMNTMEGK